MRRELAMLSTILYAAGCAGRGGAAPADTAHVDAMAHQHAGESPTANASQAEPRQEVAAREVVYGTAGGRELHGYVAFPTSARAGAHLPGVVMIHEWWGLNDNIRMTARRLAGEGYRVLAVDLYGQVATTPDQARGLMMQVMQNRPAAAENLQAATDYLRGRMGAPKVGVIGWCFGGGWSLQTALLFPDRIDAAAVYYGQPVTDGSSSPACARPSPASSACATRESRRTACGRWRASCAPSARPSTSTSTTRATPSPTPPAPPTTPGPPPTPGRAPWTCSRAH